MYMELILGGEQVFAQGAVGRQWQRQSRDDYNFLLVEDNELNAYVFQGYLEELGYKEAVWAKSLSEAETYIDDIRNGVYDLVFLDIMLPDGESWSLASRLAASQTTPICAYTARVSHLDAAQCRKVGFAHVFRKPLDLEYFDGTLDELLSGGALG